MEIWERDALDLEYDDTINIINRVFSLFLVIILVDPRFLIFAYSQPVL